MIRNLMILALFFGISFISNGASVSDFTIVNTDKDEETDFIDSKSKPEAAKSNDNYIKNGYLKNLKPEQSTSYRSILEKNKIINIKQNPFSFQELFLGSSNGPNFFSLLSPSEGINDEGLIYNAMAWEEMKLSLKNFDTVWNSVDAWATISLIEYMEDANLSVINLPDINSKEVHNDLKKSTSQIRDSNFSTNFNNIASADPLNKEESTLLYRIFNFSFFWEALSDNIVPLLILATLWISIKILIIFLKPKASQSKKSSKNRSIDGFIDL
ncbi:MAG: hypothetical protein PHY16_16450 [Methylobacter sp.]|nr:hypothetical protein [Methylobacter sp.]